MMLEDDLKPAKFALDKSYQFAKEHFSSTSIPIPIGGYSPCTAVGDEWNQFIGHLESIVSVEHVHLLSGRRSFQISSTFFAKIPMLLLWT